MSFCLVCLHVLQARCQSGISFLALKRNTDTCQTTFVWAKAYFLFLLFVDSYILDTHLWVLIIKVM